MARFRASRPEPRLQTAMLPSTLAPFDCEIERSPRQVPSFAVSTLFPATVFRRTVTLSDQVTWIPLPPLP